MTTTSPDTIKPTRIKRLRTLRGETQAAFGAPFLASANDVSRWESGKSKPNGEQTKALRALLKQEQEKIALSVASGTTTTPIAAFMTPSAIGQDDQGAPSSAQTATTLPAPADQDALLADLAEKIRAANAQADATLGTWCDRAAEAGRLLNEARPLLDRGAWLPWVAACGLQWRTAQRYMKTAKQKEEGTLTGATATPSRAQGEPKAKDASKKPMTIKQIVAAKRHLATLAERLGLTKPLAVGLTPDQTAMVRALREAAGRVTAEIERVVTPALAVAADATAEDVEANSAA